MPLSLCFRAVYLCRDARSTSSRLIRMNQEDTFLRLYQVSPPLAPRVRPPPPLFLPLVHFTPLKKHLGNGTNSFASRDGVVMFTGSDYIYLEIKIRLMSCLLCSEV